jgi:hypothetical protein
MNVTNYAVYKEKNCVEDPKQCANIVAIINKICALCM